MSTARLIPPSPNVNTRKRRRDGVQYPSTELVESNDANSQISHSVSGIPTAGIVKELKSRGQLSHQVEQEPATAYWRKLAKQLQSDLKTAEAQVLDTSLARNAAEARVVEQDALLEALRQSCLRHTRDLNHAISKREQAVAEITALSVDLNDAQEENESLHDMLRRENMDMKEALRMLNEDHAHLHTQGDPPPYASVRHQDKGRLVIASVERCQWKNLIEDLARTTGSQDEETMNALVEACTNASSLPFGSPSYTAGTILGFCSRVVSYPTFVSDAASGSARARVLRCWCKLDDILQDVMKRAVQNIRISFRWHCPDCASSVCTRARACNEKLWRQARMAAIVQYRQQASHITEAMGPLMDPAHSGGVLSATLEWLTEAARDEQRRLHGVRERFCNRRAAKVASEIIEINESLSVSNRAALARMDMSVSFYLLICDIALCAALTAEKWSAQSIYQVMTDRFAPTQYPLPSCTDLAHYCGGTWQGIARNLDYIQGLGATAIWISPVVSNINATTPSGSSYHGYWANDIYNLNKNFGSAADLIALSRAVHNRGMYLIVDIVPNHMASASSRASVDYAALLPFDNADDYHQPCAIDYNDDTSVKLCWEGDNTVSLADLKTEDHGVREVWNAWVTDFVLKFEVDGLRIDSARQVERDFWPGFLNATGSRFALGEVWVQDFETLCPYQEQLPGVMSYPMYSEVTETFQSSKGDMRRLSQAVEQLWSICPSPFTVGSFLENHDNPRFPSFTSDLSLVQNAIAFTFFSGGIPIIYQGQEQHFSGSTVPTNREPLWLSNYTTSSTLYRFISRLNKVRTQSGLNDALYFQSAPQTTYSTSSHIMLGKGSSATKTFGLFTNTGSGLNSSITINAAQLGKESITDLISCQEVSADRRGHFRVRIQNGLPQILCRSSLELTRSLCHVR